jgi:hypothetical protein
MELHEQYGNQWVKMATIMKGRSDNHIKNHWNAALRKREAVARGGHTPPRTRTRRKIDTPDSIAQLPKPNLDSVLVPQPPAIPSLMWTPIVSQLDAISPISLVEKSPFVFGSPSFRPTQLSPWAADFMKTPGSCAFLFSPRIGGTDDTGPLVTILYTMGKD